MKMTADIYDSYERFLNCYIKKGTIAAVVLTFLDRSLSFKNKNKNKKKTPMEYLIRAAHNPSVVYTHHLLHWNYGIAESVKGYGCYRTAKNSVCTHPSSSDRSIQLLPITLEILYNQWKYKTRKLGWWWCGDAWISSLQSHSFDVFLIIFLVFSLYFSLFALFFFLQSPEFRLRYRMYSEANGDVARSILSEHIYDRDHQSVLTTYGVELREKMLLWQGTTTSGIQNKLP